MKLNSIYTPCPKCSAERLVYLINRDTYHCRECQANFGVAESGECGDEIANEHPFLLPARENP